MFPLGSSFLYINCQFIFKKGILWRAKTQTTILVSLDGRQFITSNWLQLWAILFDRIFGLWNYIANDQEIGMQQLLTSLKYL